MNASRFSARGLRATLVVLGLLVGVSAATAQPRIYTGDGSPASLDDVVAASDSVDVVFVGEVHDDSVGHAVQDSLWHRLVARYAPAHNRASDSASDPSAAPRPLALSLEMFERDVQPVLDEYLAGQIAERHFVDDARAWRGYAAAHRSLVETAKARGLPVLAANAPRRYVNRVAQSASGRASLASLSDWAKQWLAPLPYPGPSDAYRAKWDRLMREAMPPGHGAPASRETSPETETSPENGTPSEGETPHAEENPHGAGAVADPEASEAHAHPHGASSGSSRGPSPMLQAQALWDATMAYTIADHLTRAPETLVMHVTGGFHVSRGTGTPEALRHYRPSARSLVVMIRPVDDPTAFDADAHAGMGDFVVLTPTGL